MPRPHFTPGKDPVPFYRRLGGPQGWSGRAENLVPTGIRSRTVQPVIGRYTYWATRPTCFVCVVIIIHCKNIYYCNSQSQSSHAKVSLPYKLIDTHVMKATVAAGQVVNRHVSLQWVFTDSQNRLNWFTTVSTGKANQYCLITLHKNQNKFACNITSLTNVMVMRIIFRRWRLVWRNGVCLSTGKSSFTPLCDCHCADFNEIRPFSDTLWKTPTPEFMIIWQTDELVILGHGRTDGRTFSSKKASCIYFVKKHFQPVF